MSAGGATAAGSVPRGADEPTLVVDLDAFAANLDVVRARIAPAELMLVVKDDAYGHGLAEIVTRASCEGIRWFGAFDVAGALATRAVAAPGARIFAWLTVGAAEIADALDADIDLGVGDASFLEDVAAVAVNAGKTARVHLKIDTGLHRNGVRPESWPAFVRRARELELSAAIDVIGIWSHIAEASDAEDDNARAVYDEAVRQAGVAGLTISRRHLSASAASFARAEYRYDIARVGAFCYGIRSAGGPGEDELGIRPIASLKAAVTAVGDVTVTIGVGSLHGLFSTLAGHMQVTVGSRHVLLRTVGRATSTVDAWPDARVGDAVTLWGAGSASATDLAEVIDTVGEEVLLRVSPRVSREYPVGAH